MCKDMHGYGRRGYGRRGYGSYNGGGYRRPYYDNGAGCEFCTGVPENMESHTRSRCSVFRELKKKVTKRPYVQAHLRDVDEQGFAAAGFLLWRKEDDDVQILMAREYRNGMDKLNFLGGKRWRKAETAIEVALKKSDMESGKQLSRSTVESMQQAPLVHWSGDSSKYALFLYELTSWRDVNVDVMAAGVRREGVMRLEWVSCKHLKIDRFRGRELHEFADEMVEVLADCECDVLANIKELFETADSARTPAAVGGTEKQEGDELFDFDVIAAIKTSASLARGVKASSTMTSRSITDAARSLPKTDLRKLQLKFHPDKLCLQLGRDPTEIEKKASSKAMQVLNQVTDMVANTTSRSSDNLLKIIEELNQLIKEYHKGDASDDKVGNVAEAITAKLSEIRLGT